MSLSANVRKIRSARYLTQENAAELSGLSVRTIQRIEAGKNVDADSVQALAQAFDIPAAVLAAESTTEPSETDKAWERDGFLVPRVRSGRALLNLTIGSHMSVFDHDDTDPVDTATVGEFLQDITDINTVGDVMEPIHRVEAAEHFAATIRDLEERGWHVFAARRSEHYRFASDAPGQPAAALQVLYVLVFREDNPYIRRHGDKEMVPCLHAETVRREPPDRGQDREAQNS